MFDTISLTNFIWIVAGIVLTVLEFIIPGVITIFFGFGALFTGILSIFFDISLNIQILIFLGSSVISLVFLRKYLKAVFVGLKKDNTYSSINSSEHIGKTAIAESRIGPKLRGTVLFNGTVWEADSSEEIEKGDPVIITGVESIIFQVTKKV